MSPSRWAALAALGLLAACGGSPESRFYLLDPATPPVEPAAQGPRIFVDRPGIARHLDRPQLVRRLDEHRIGVTEFEVWGEPLDAVIARAVVDALAARFGRDRVQLTPARRDVEPDLRLSLDVLRFDTDATDAVVLDARWTLLAGAAERFAGTGRERITEPVPPPVTPEARVAASARAIGRLVDNLTPWIERAMRR